MSIDSLCMRDCPRKAPLAFRSIREIICGWPLWLLATTIAVYCTALRRTALSATESSLGPSHSTIRR